MAATVNTAFVEFMKDTVNLDSNQIKTARTSRDNLLTNLKSFSSDSFFCNLLLQFTLRKHHLKRRTGT